MSKYKVRFNLKIIEAATVNLPMKRWLGWQVGPFCPEARIFLKRHLSSASLSCTKADSTTRFTFFLNNLEIYKFNINQIFELLKWQAGFSAIYLSSETKWFFYKLYDIKLYGPFYTVGLGNWEFRGKSAIKYCIWNT